MKIFVKAKPNAKTDRIEELKHHPAGTDPKRNATPNYKVSVKATPTDGKANDAIIRVVAAHFRVARAQVRIMNGLTTSRKIIEVTGSSFRK